MAILPKGPLKPWYTGTGSPVANGIAILLLGGIRFLFYLVPPDPTYKMTTISASNLSERQIQAVLMRWVLDELNHLIAAPNITNVFRWECDLLSVTRAHLAHEWEIKRSVADYRKDKEKRWKHSLFFGEFPHITRYPNYFWYVTGDFDIEPPEYAGWIKLMDLGNDKAPQMFHKKPAPRLHRNHLTPKQLIDMGRIAAYQLKKMWVRRYLNSSSRRF